ncbi:MAG: DnaA N-terminal domain-containing protein, partial [Bacteroidota bacterium]
MQKSLEQVWENCLALIRDNVSAQNFKTWFEPIKPVKLDNKVLTIEVPSQFVYEWLEEHYLDLLRKSIKQQLGPQGRLEYSIVMENNQNASQPYTVKMPAKNNSSLKNSPVAMPLDIGSTIRNPFIIPGLKKLDVDSQLKSSFSFENFIEGDCNRLARSAGFA